MRVESEPEQLKTRRKRQSMKGVSLFALIAGLAFASSCFVVNGDYIPPATFDGFVYPGHQIKQGTILIEAFYDPLCPDSRDSWSPLKLALKHYGRRVAFVLHLLPLPYHDNAYVASRALHVVDKHNRRDTFKFLESFFKHQERFSGSRTHNTSRAAVLDDIVKFAAESLGDSYHSLLQAGLKDDKTDLATRVSFKYSALRGVYGTPTFYVNGFLSSEAGFDAGYIGWRKIIDPLLTGDNVKENQEPRTMAGQRKS